MDLDDAVKRVYLAAGHLGSQVGLTNPGLTIYPVSPDLGGSVKYDSIVDVTALTSDLLAAGNELAGAAKFACDYPGPFEIDAVLAAVDDWDRTVSRFREIDIVLVPVTRQLIAASDGQWKNVDVQLQSDGQMFFRVPDGRDTST